MMVPGARKIDSQPRAGQRRRVLDGLADG